MKPRLDLNRAGKRIARRYEKRLASDREPESQGPHSKPEARLLRESYRLTRRVGRRFDPQELHEAVRIHAHPRGRLAGMVSAWVLSCVYGNLGPVTKATRNKIRLHAYALDYALQRKVPAKFLTGFIYQVGGFSAIEKLYARPRKPAPRAEAKSGRRRRRPAHARNGSARERHRHSKANRV